jgi:uncharacterized membrane protein YeaQ/YmgE (transglycosylase-associated protein family)
MPFFAAIIIGFVVGLIAKVLMPGRDPGGFLITMSLGVAGALLATGIGHVAGWYHTDQTAGIIGAVAGAVVILGISRVVSGLCRRSDTNADRVPGAE